MESEPGVLDLAVEWQPQYREQRVPISRESDVMDRVPSLRRVKVKTMPDKC